MNLVTTLAVRTDGLEFPLSWRFWKKAGTNDQKITKFHLAQEMLNDIRAVIPLTKSPEGNYLLFSRKERQV